MNKYVPAPFITAFQTFTKYKKLRKTLTSYAASTTYYMYILYVQKGHYSAFL